MCAPGKGLIMQIKQLPESQRPIEKLLFAGASCLSNAELLAILIGSGTKNKSAIEVANEVLAFASSDIGELGLADPRELMQISGIGEVKACTIIAALELSKRLMSDSVRERIPTLECGDDVAQLLIHEMGYERRELFMVIFLNTKLMIEGKMVISIGNLDTAPVHPREVFGPAVRRGAAAVIVAHNHPSGDPTPSHEDIAVTLRLQESANLIGIKLLDHVIVGKGSFTSMKAEGYIT